MEGKKLRLILGSRLLRKKSTRSENILWKYLSNRGMIGYKFRRQHPINRFILDFYCPEKKLAIEIDGKIHNNKKDYDQARQELLENMGISFLRFSNEEVKLNIDMVLRSIKRKLNNENDYPLSTQWRGVAESRCNRDEDGVRCL
jgi:very-short-patch-repair endonuclease